MKCHKEDAPLLGLMGQSMRLIGKRAQELYAEYDLNRAQSGILFALHQEDSMSQKELAKRLNVTPPSITSMIKKFPGFCFSNAEHGCYLLNGVCFKEIVCFTQYNHLYKLD